VATRLTLCAALLALLSACYKLPSDGCPQTPCGVDLVCIQGLCVTPASPVIDAGQPLPDARTAPTDAATPPQDAGSTDTGVAIDAGPESVCGNGILEAGEDCDDGDIVNAGCIDCVAEPFGTGFVLGPNFGCSIVPHPSENTERVGNGVACWGRNDFGQMGADLIIPRRVVPVLQPSPWLQNVVQIAGAEATICAVTAQSGEDRLYCWGNNTQMFLSTPASELQKDPVEIHLPRTSEGGPRPVIHQIAMGRDHACVILGGERQVYCWGVTANGRLGIGGNIEESSRHAFDMAVGNSREGGDLTHVKSLALGDRFAVAVAEVDVEGEIQLQLYGWGDVPGIDGDQGAASEMGGPIAGSIEISAGSRHYCVRMGNTDVKCGGENSTYATGASQQSSTALHDVEIPGNTKQLNRVWAFAVGSCATLESTGDQSYAGLGCWGDDTYYQLRDIVGEDTHFVTTIDLPDPSPVQIMAAGALAQWRCAQLENGSVYCWGRNEEGQTGQIYRDETNLKVPSLIRLDPQAQFGGDSAEHPLIGCEAARDRGGVRAALAKGTYYVKHTAEGMTYQAYCDTDPANDGGGWSLAIEVHGGVPTGITAGFGAAFWTTPIESDNTFEPSDIDGEEVRQNRAMFEQPFTDLALDLLPKRLLWAYSSTTLGEVEALQRPVGAMAEKRLILVDAVSERQPLGVLFSSGEAVTFSVHLATRAHWLQLSDVLDGQAIDGHSFSQALAINDTGGGDDPFSIWSCWRVGINQAFTATGEAGDPLAQMRLGVLAAPYQQSAQSGCGTAYHNFIGFGVTGMDYGPITPRTYMPAVGTFGTSASGYNRTAMWSAGRIWVR
jgi:alpha-tubulin suppressor-like RCC1 family protein